MKKVILSFAAASLLLASCGGNPSACDCAENAKKADKADMKMAEKCLELAKDAKFAEEALKCESK